MQIDAVSGIGRKKGEILKALAKLGKMIRAREKKK